MQPEANGLVAGSIGAADGVSGAVGISRKNSPRVLVGVVVVLLAVVIVALAIVSLLAKGFLYVGVKGPGQKVILQTRVCDDDVIERYNGLFIPFDEVGWEAMDEIVDEFRSKAGYEEDPTCQSILFFYFWQKQEVSGMQEALSVLKRLRQRGASVDQLVRNNLGITTMEAIINNETEQ